MAQDPIVPPDPESTQEDSVDPSKTLPNQATDQGDIRPLGGYEFYLRQGIVPFRASGGLAGNIEVFSKLDDGWMVSNQADRYEMWPASPEEVGAIVGTKRLTEPAKGVVPYMDPGDDPESDLQEADSVGDTNFTTPDDFQNETPPQGESPTPDGDETTAEVPLAMTAGQIREAGLQIDVPFEAVTPRYLTYKAGTAQQWTPPPGFREGRPPIDPLVAERLGVPPDLGANSPPNPGEQSGPPSGGPSDVSRSRDAGVPPPGPPRRVRRNPGSTN